MAQAVRRIPDAADTDGAIIERVRGGVTADFELLMRRYNQRLFRTARAILNDDTEAEDAVQEGYIQAYSQLAQIRSGGSFGAWASRIVVNLAIARRRRRSSRGEVQADELDNVIPIRADPSTPERQATVNELRRFLEEAIDELPDGWREVLVLRDVEGLSTAETASSLGVSETAAKVRLFRARRALRRRLESEFGDAIGEVFAFAGDRCDRIVNRVLERLAD